jgi:hypothetical protein
MKLVVPHTGELLPADARLVRLAEFLGISCEVLFLDGGVQDHAEYFEKSLTDRFHCLVVNPQVIMAWTGGVLSADLISCLISRFPYLLVHGLTGDPSEENLIRGLSADRLRSARRIADSGHRYEIASDSREICGAFAGLSFGPVNSLNDRVFCGDIDHLPGRVLISIGGDPFMMVMKQDRAEILFLASADTIDVSSEVGNAPLSDYFSRFVPQAMALRHIFGEYCWHPREHHASLIIDDPLLRPRYGFLDFEELLHLMEKYNFFTTIAFIPHNYRRNSKRIVRLFNENRNRFGICFHGNDHTLAELASTDASHLNSILQVAEARMNDLHQAAGLPCSKVMVFPQGKFSVEAMKVLKSRNFLASANSRPHPSKSSVKLSLAELSQPAVLRWEGFPLFLRGTVRLTKQEIAFNEFFGRPILVEEHHEVFRQPGNVAQIVTTINSVVPEIHWSDLETVACSSILQRKMFDGTYHVRAYSGMVRIANDRECSQRFIIEWNYPDDSVAVEQVLRDGVTDHPYEIDDSRIRLSVALAPGTSCTFSVVYRNSDSSQVNLGFRWDAKVFVRRRVAEMMDNYVSKNQFVSTLTKTLRQRVRRGK